MTDLPQEVEAAAKGGGARSNRAPVPALQVGGITKSFGGKTVLHPFQLTVEAGQVHMLLGQNGSGKSTLIKVLAGFHQPDSDGELVVGGRSVVPGSAESAKQAGLRFVHQDLGLIDTETVLDNVVYTSGYPTRLGTIRGGEVRQQVEDVLARVGLDVEPSALVRKLSPAQRTGVALARAILPGAHPVAALVLDEPTATLPPNEVARLHGMLRTATRNGVGVLYVTHHLDEVQLLADQVSVLRDGHLVLSSPVAEVDRRTLVHRLIGGELEAVMRTAATSHGEAVDDERIRVGQLSGERLNGVDFVAHGGEVVGFYGLTGSGRETLLATVFGALPRHAGSVTVATCTTLPSRRPAAAIRAGVAYLSPDRKTTGGFMSLTATENLTLTGMKMFWRKGIMRRRPEEAHAKEWFTRLDVRPSDGVSNPLATFSGGNQQKILMAKWLRLSPSVLLLDEPTQGVDVGAKAELHRQILKCKERGTAIVISSTDIDELTALCDRVLIMDHGRVKRELRGGDISEHNINSGFLEESGVTDR